MKKDTELYLGDKMIKFFKKFLYPKVYEVGSVYNGRDEVILKEISDGERLIINQEVRDVINFTIARIKYIDDEVKLLKEELHRERRQIEKYIEYKEMQLNSLKEEIERQRVK